MKIEAADLARLRSQASRAEIILFTGAGFSVGAKDFSGRLIPSGWQLKRELWEFCYGKEPFDDSSSLGDIYGAALRLKRSDLAAFLQERLIVDPRTLPEYYQTLFNFPWFRCYTLNVDDLESAVARQFGVERQPLSISARETGVARLPVQGLEVIHLNGLLPAPPEALTFSESQYAERIGDHEPWYSRCVVDITSRPVIFIGTTLQESLLWQHMELRRRREHLGRDLRPTSLLITTDLPRPRQDILRDLRINWVQGTAEQFANEVLTQLRTEATQGFTFIRQHSDGRQSGYIPLVSHLAGEQPKLETEYLMGEEPRWADILSGRAIERSDDQVLLKLSEPILAGERPSTAIAVTGTAGNGKSTALMSLALKLSGNGVPVLWVDKDLNISPAKIRSRVREMQGKVVLAIDDADLYGRELVNLLADLVPETPDFLFVFAARSGKLSEVQDGLQGNGRLKVVEHVVSPLSDSDIDGLIAVLEKNKRLGILTGASMDDRRQAFREQAGRQLLVAMIQATSGQNFERKAQDEYLELKGPERYVYALVTVASSLRYTVTKDEVLLAGGDSHEEYLVALERLAAHHLLVAKPSTGEFRSRHRVVSDLVFEKLKELGDLAEVLVGLSWALASKVGLPLDRTSRTAKFLVRLINHDFLLRTIGVMSARDFYTRLEAVLSFDYHYWLQRGSLEVEVGDIKKAENFLGASRSLGAGDYRVDTAYAYMLMRKAWEAPRDLHSEEFLRSGMEELETVIEHWGHVSEYPYHVLGSQGLTWAHRAVPDGEERRAFLDKILKSVQDGVAMHPKSEALSRLRDTLKKEVLLTVTSGFAAPQIPSNSVDTK
jgi:Mrp family chromosome partitioning ATPase